MAKTSNEPHAKRLGWLRNGSPTGDPRKHLAVRLKLGKERYARAQLCVMDVAGCTEARALAHARHKAVRVHREPIGSMGCIPQRRSCKRVSCGSSSMNAAVTPHVFLTRQSFPFSN
jgi:hypothetical protein